MNKVALTLESKDVGADDLEEALEAFKPIVALMFDTTAVQSHVVVMEED